MALEFPDLIKSLPVFEGPFDAFKLESDRFKVLFASYPAGTDVPEHEHASENLGIVTQGSLYLTTNGETRCLETGAWYHLDCHQRHAARFDQDTQIIEFWFDRG